MSSLTLLEKRRFEKLLGMHTGYVLDFSNQTFQAFVLDVTGKDIYDSTYDYSSGSKANRLRAFWTSESDYVVAKLLEALLEHAKYLGGEEQLVRECTRIVERLQLNLPIPDFQVLEIKTIDRDFEALAAGLKEALQRNEPETELDRLHTFVIKYIRLLCQRHGIEVDRDKPLHSLFGEYVKSLRRRELIESDMAERILKSSISILEAFNDVRNNRSFAHDNRLLTYHEALLIYNNVLGTLRFISAIDQVAGEVSTSPRQNDDDIPF